MWIWLWVYISVSFRDVLLRRQSRNALKSHTVSHIPKYKQPSTSTVFPVDHWAAPLVQLRPAPHTRLQTSAICNCGWVPGPVGSSVGTLHFTPSSKTLKSRNQSIYKTRITENPTYVLYSGCVNGKGSNTQLWCLASLLLQQWSWVLL